MAAHPWFSRVMRSFLNPNGGYYGGWFSVSKASRFDCRHISAQAFLHKMPCLSQIAASVDEDSARQESLALRLEDTQLAYLPGTNYSM